MTRYRIAANCGHRTIQVWKVGGKELCNDCAVDEVNAIGERIDSTVPREAEDDGVDE